MTYQETLDFMYSQLPMYHRIGAAAYKADLQPTLDLMEALGHPERKFCSIHVAGTNGKGSVSHMLASILQESNASGIAGRAGAGQGYKVGLYTSPHLVDFRERIRINGEMIPQSAVVDFVDRNRQLFDRLHLSFFEMTVGLAFDYFAREQVDIAVVEVGMGGRLDSTNVMPPIGTSPKLGEVADRRSDGGVCLSVITNIGLDHTQFLGDTLEKIAAEKAGIIKEGVPVVVGETQPETEPLFRRIAAGKMAPITFADQHWEVRSEHPEGDLSTLEREKNVAKKGEGRVQEKGDDSETYTVVSLLTSHFSLFTSQLTGEYQKKNIATVLEAVEVLRKTALASSSPKLGELSAKLTEECVHRGLARVVTNTHLQGRWQTIGENPLTICETAHNEPGIRAMLGKLQTMEIRHLHLIYGCVGDKDYRHILQLLTSQLSLLTSSLHFFLSPRCSDPLRGAHFSFYFTQPSVPRRLPVADLVAAARDLGIEGTAYDNVKDALAAARAQAHPSDLVLVTGSIFLVADALAAK